MAQARKCTPLNSIRYRHMRQMDPNLRSRSMDCLKSARSDEMDEQELACEGYNRVRTIWKGHYCVIKNAEHEASKKTVKLKVIDADMAPHTYLEQTINEMINMQNLNHASFIPFIDTFMISSRIYLVAEIAGRGTLGSFIGIRGPIPEKVCKLMYRQLVEGLCFCHEQKIALKNINVSSIHLDKYHNVVIADISWSEELLPDNNHNIVTQRPNSPYTAPEALRRQPYAAFPADVFAAGAVLFSMLYRMRLPFYTQHEISSQQERNRIITFPASPVITSEAVRLMRAMMNNNPSERIKTADLKRHAWFSDTPYVVMDASYGHIFNYKTNTNQDTVPWLLKVKAPLVLEISALSETAEDIDDSSQSGSN